MATACVNEVMCFTAYSKKHTCNSTLYITNKNLCILLGFYVSFTEQGDLLTAADLRPSCAFSVGLWALFCVRKINISGNNIIADQLLGFCHAAS